MVRYNFEILLYESQCSMLQSEGKKEGISAIITNQFLNIINVDTVTL